MSGPGGAFYENLKSAGLKDEVQNISLMHFNIITVANTYYAKGNTKRDINILYCTYGTVVTVIQKCFHNNVH